MIGEKIGNYVITEKLGEGGMGEVYLAAHPQIGKKVALKVLHPELASNEEITTRFFHEAKAVNDISHPNIVDILDFGSMPTERGNIVYLVMELLKGQTLTKAVAEGPLDPLRAVRIMRQVADALVASHERRIIHRDLKPDNIMLVARGRDPEFVKLLDFGIAKMTGAGAPSSKTRTGMVIGTPIYMSPEQCEGRADIDHRTDVYALGTVLYELICGAPPFTGTGYAEILVKQLTETPEPVTQRRPGISRYLESIINKALAKRREDRFQTMREVLEALSNPQEFVDARGGVAAFGGPSRSNPPTGPQMPTPYTGAAQATPLTGNMTQQGYNTPFTGQGGQPTPLHGQGMPTPMHGQGMPTPLHGGGYATPTPMHGQAMPTPMHGQAMPTPMHGGYATPTPMHGQPGVPHQTTLSQGVGELGRAGRGTQPPPDATMVTSGSNKKLLIGGAIGVVLIAGVAIALVAGGGSGKTQAAQTTQTTDGSGSASTAGNPATTTSGSATTNESGNSAAGSATTATANSGSAGADTSAGSATTAASISKIRVETTPKDASVFVGAETKARCQTPCTVDVPRADGNETIVIKLAGYNDEKRPVSAKADFGLNIELTKKRTSGTTTGTTGTRPRGTGTGSGSARSKDGPLGDNTENPFDN
jgi:hypothetical protein